LGGAALSGVSEIGRVTVHVLAINDAQDIVKRLELIEQGLF
jgi:hypothetical protein